MMSGKLRLAQWGVYPIRNVAGLALFSFRLRHKFVPRPASRDFLTSQVLRGLTRAPRFSVGLGHTSSSLESAITGAPGAEGAKVPDARVGASTRVEAPRLLRAPRARRAPTASGPRQFLWRIGNIFVKWGGLAVQARLHDPPLEGHGDTSPRTAFMVILVRVRACPKPGILQAESCAETCADTGRFDSPNGRTDRDRTPPGVAFVCTTPLRGSAQSIHRIAPRPAGHGRKPPRPFGSPCSSGQVAGTPAVRRTRRPSRVILVAASLWASRPAPRVAKPSRRRGL